MAIAFDAVKKQAKILGVALSVFAALSALNTNIASAVGDNGILIGDARVHPFLDFHSNFVSNPNRAGSETAQSDLALTVRPGFNLELNGNSTELFFTGAAEYKHYLGLNDGETPVTANLSRWNANVGLEGKFLKQGSSPLRLKLNFAHNEDPRNQTVNQKLTHNLIDANLGIDMSPGGGALKLTLDYAPALDLYPEADEALATHRHALTFKTLWKFLPKTATFFETKFDALMYLNDGVAFEATIDGVATPISNQDLQILSVYTGLTGRITEKFGILIRAGYGQAFLTDEQLVTGESNPAGFLGQVDLKFKSSDTITLGAGFNRTLSGAAIYKYMIDNNIYIESKATLARRWGFSVKGSVSMLEYGKAVENDPDRSDTMIRVEAVASVAVTDWFVIALVDKVETLITDYSLNGNEPPKYFYNDLFLRLSVRY
jgi:hypothetical protein